jgi:FMN phosphatase YigB (HAD superfamily)
MELEEFRTNFKQQNTKKIVLYGIGRYTATLTEGLKEFHFVGLMDKDPANTGKILFGLPVMDLREAEEKADLIVINTAETYWRIIYGRICESRIPIFYRNGKKAEREPEKKKQNPFPGLSHEAMSGAAEAAEIVSFDFFDTLFMRSVCNPRDIVYLLETQMGENWKYKESFSELRERAKRAIRKNYCIDELYGQMEILCGTPAGSFKAIQKKELEIEKRLLVPRPEVLHCLKTCLEQGKETYIISDMYLPEAFYREVLEQQGIRMPLGHILLSHMLDACKADGGMWQKYHERIGGKGPCLHLGDDRQADIAAPAAYGIGTYCVPGAWDLLEVSSLQETVCHVRSLYDSAVMGCILKKLFCSPYAPGGSAGKIQINGHYEMGYCIFGPVILTFLLWLMEKSEEDDVRKLVFMSRDGYFLREDYEYLHRLTGEGRASCYIGISRQLAMSAAIETKQELLEYASMPYTGTAAELLEDRFGIRALMDTRAEDAPKGTMDPPVSTKTDLSIEWYVEQNLPEINRRIGELKENYLQYIREKDLDDTCAVVDLGYYGNNQRYLNKLSGKNMQGYYFNANLSGGNANTACQKMTACFQKADDPAGEKSGILRQQIYLESFLTAPYGMVKAVDGEGNFLCAEKKKNQEYFREREEINRGVQAFMDEYVRLFGDFHLRPTVEFTDWYFGHCLGGAVEFSECIKKSFYNDNAMMNRIESMLFY